MPKDVDVDVVIDLLDVLWGTTFVMEESFQIFQDYAKFSYCLRLLNTRLNILFINMVFTVLTENLVFLAELMIRYRSGGCHIWFLEDFAFLVQPNPLQTFEDPLMLIYLLGIIQEFLRFPTTIYFNTSPFIISLNGKETKNDQKLCTDRTEITREIPHRQRKKITRRSVSHPPDMHRR